MNASSTFKSNRFLAAACTLLILAASPAASADEGPLYDVGAAKVDITPDYPIRLNGFGFRREESEGVTQRIWAKALAINAPGGPPVIILAVDSTGLRLSMVKDVATRLKAKAGIEPERIAVTFTHTHTSPKVSGACDTIFSTPIPVEHQVHIHRYTRELADALEKVALAALENRRPARLSWAVGSVGFAKNRRTAGGPVDHSLPVLAATAENGDLLAVYTTYACHCVTLSHNKIGGDWAGYAQTAVERNHPGAVALVSIGCGSDSNPESGVTGDNVAVAAEQGDQIAYEVDRIIRGSMRPVSGEPAAALSIIDLPLREPPTRDELQTLAESATPEGFNAQQQLAKLDRGESLQTAIAYPVQSIVFGKSLAMAFLGGEVCVDYSLRLKGELDAERCWLHGYSNDFCSYIPSERLLGEGGYGGGGEIPYFALPAPLAPGLENRIVSEVLKQIPRSFHANAASSSK